MKDCPGGIHDERSSMLTRSFDYLLDNTFVFPNYISYLEWGLITMYEESMRYS